MNDKYLYNRLEDKKVFDRAFVYAVDDRINNKKFCNFFEINFYRDRKPDLHKEISEIVKEPDKFQHSVCFSYYLPKENLCFRRCIYTPFKELVLRYMLIIVIVERTEYGLSQRCFSARVASPDNRDQCLLEPYTNLWNNFVDWQEKIVASQEKVDDLEPSQTENLIKQKDYQILVKTDISSFYDTVSHDYLIQIIINELDITEDCNFIKLLKKILQFRVIGYSFIDGKHFISNFLQGLIIGNSIEAYLANLYLKDLDEALENSGAEFGRYVDDIKVFVRDINDAIHYIQIIQEFLFKKGLNINTAKTKIIYKKEEIIKYIQKSKICESYDEDIEEEKKVQIKTKVKFPIDKKIDESGKYFGNDYDIDAEIDNEEDAVIWAKYLNEKLSPPKSYSSTKELELIIKQIEKLRDVMKKFGKPCKICAWLTVKFCFLEYDNSIKKSAYKEMIGILEDNEINSWVKARILHHLISPKRGSISYIKRLKTSNNRMKKMKLVLEKLASYPAIELQINSLYAIYETLESKSEITDVVKRLIPKPIPLPINDIISQLRETDFSDHKLPTFDELIPELIEEPELLEEDYD
ncbi:MAG: reverse transcriptase domain-containing protein [Microcoleaceae cyanobacterium MO_207.B10]|nr:reverse transcriptase domain-containing protein [Microcoleaceae cyanobacterium MO_207.B10]